MTLPELLEWYLDHLDPVPSRLHVRGVWADQEGGSLLGTPAWDHGFARWLQSPPHAVVEDHVEMPCFHAGGRPCRSCATYLEDGSVWETGVQKASRLRYRWPMRRTLYRVSLIPVKPGRPSMDSALLAIQHADGDLGRAATTLAIRHPAMANPRFARGFFIFALRRAHLLYEEEPPPVGVRRPYSHRSRQKSDSQLDAEAAGGLDSRQPGLPVPALAAEA